MHNVCTSHIISPEVSPTSFPNTFFVLPTIDKECPGCAAGNTPDNVCEKLYGIQEETYRISVDIEKLEKEVDRLVARIGVLSVGKKRKGRRAASNQQQKLNTSRSRLQTRLDTLEHLETKRDRWNMLAEDLRRNWGSSFAYRMDWVDEERKNGYHDHMAHR
ncbi:MAG: hypothetical protein MMC23_001995 [Stictis urceolatum]|nr:hypothetical protein [Stictis urceolata]